MSSKKKMKQEIVKTHQSKELNEFVKLLKDITTEQREELKEYLDYLSNEAKQEKVFTCKFKYKELRQLAGLLTHCVCSIYGKCDNKEYEGKEILRNCHLFTECEGGTKTICKDLRAKIEDIVSKDEKNESN